MGELKNTEKLSEFIILINEKTNRIDANVVYEKVGKNYVGVYFGYEGGGISSDGFFFLDSKFKGVVTKDETDIPSEYTEKLYELQRIRAEFSDWEVNDDGSQASHYAMQYKPDNEGLIPLFDHSDDDNDNWEYSSKNWDSRVWNSLYEQWSLIV